MSQRGLLREPFVHFAVLGLLLFGVWELAADEDAEAAMEDGQRAVSIKAEEVEMLSLSYVERNGSDPSAAELERLVGERVDEEILYLEGLAAGLHLGDPVVRRRVIQKQRFLFEETHPAEEPTEDEISARIDAMPDRYRSSEAVAFNQHFFDGERRHNAEDDARRALVDLDASEITPSGDPFVHGTDFGLRSLDSYRDQLGPALANVLKDSAVGEWFIAPTRWGWHLVQVTERASSSELTEESVRKQARFDLLEERRIGSVDKGLSEARAGYAVTVEGRE